MKISELWLRESVDLIGITREELLKKLTAAGLEVEGCEPVAPEFSGVVVGEIIACEKIPDSNKLRLCTVNIGQAQALQIVCGAPNARVGLKAPLATVGAILPNDFRIKVGNLRGVDSFGMLCSSTELGLPAGTDGLLELPQAAPVGQSIRDYLKLDDAVIELKMTPNRSDCLGVLGLTRELSALFARPVTLSVPQPQAIAAPFGAQTLSITLQDPSACPRYLGQVVRGARVDVDTPIWMQERLRRSGVRVHSPIVDITNYVLLELGQPMHAFDLRTIEQQITVRRAHSGESLKLLDEQTVKLDAEFLVIADAKKVLAIAGIMGGFDSRVQSNTTDILLEAAHFSPAAIMGKARRLGLHTDSSHRFERGVDPNLPAIAMARAVQLITDLCGGIAEALITQVSNDHLPIPQSVHLRKAKLQRVLGLAIDDAKVEAILRNLGFAVTTITGGWQVQAHSARFDIQIEEDLIEEVARVHSYDLIPITLPSLQASPLVQMETKALATDVRLQLCARGYAEAITFAFTDSAQLTHFGLKGHAIKNPLASDIDVMRPSLLPNLLNALMQNQCRQVDRVRLFEQGVVFSEQGKVETPMLAAVAVGSARAEQWGEATRAVDFYDLKGDLQSLAPLLACKVFNASQRPKFLHPSRSAELHLGDHAVGMIGQLHPQIIKLLDLKGAPVVFEVALAAVQAKQIPKSQTLSKFPSSRRDLAIVVRETVAFEAIAQIMRRLAGERLIELQCFDVYRGQGLPEAHKSLAISLNLQERSRTLGVEEVDDLMAKIIAAISSELGGSIRA
jgi:phenylalanyl-tRNA synthetase beta chain